MSLLDIGLQGLVLEYDGTSIFEPTIRSCNSMKSMRLVASD